MQWFDEMVPVTNEDTIKTFFDFYSLHEYKASCPLVPIIFGSLTNWVPYKMMPAVYHSMLLMAKQAETL